MSGGCRGWLSPPLVLDDIALLGFGLQTPDVLKQLRAAAESN